MEIEGIKKLDASRQCERIFTGGKRTAPLQVRNAAKMLRQMKCLKEFVLEQRRRGSVIQWGNTYIKVKPWLTAFIHVLIDLGAGDQLQARRRGNRIPWMPFQEIEQHNGE